MKPDVLDVKDLKVYYHTPRGAVKAVDGVSFQLFAEERLGLVGESGSGKTTIAMALLRMIKAPGKIEGGEIWLEGADQVLARHGGKNGNGQYAKGGKVNLQTLTDEQMVSLRLSAIALIAQGSMNSLNPVMRIRDQIADGYQDHGYKLTKQELKERTADLLNRVGLRPSVADMYPHELSGGMKQRVCIAIAISLSPKVILADEPTSALDVVVQRQVMETLRRVQEELGASVLLVGHDMGLMAQAVDRLGVMYAGKMAEVSPVHDIFTKPLHPYAQLLIASLPSLDVKGEFKGIPGLPPSLLEDIPGCPFAPRCPYKMERCEVEKPILKEVAPNRHVACFLVEGAK